jgi:hypothetical protein
LTGTFVNVYGRLPITTNITTIAQFVVDDNPPFIASYPPASDIPDNNGPYSSNYRLFHLTSLSSDKSHVLTITPMAEQALWLDYITAGVGVDTSNPQDTGSSVPPPSSSTTPSATGIPTGAPAFSTKTAVTIAGAVVGGVILLVVAILSIIVYYRRRRRFTEYGKGIRRLRSHRIANYSPVPEENAVTLVPYTLEHLDTPTFSKVEQARMERAMGTDDDGVVAATLEPVASPSVRRSSNTRNNKKEHIQPVSASHQNQNVDSGIRGLAPLSEDLPPVYSKE